MLSVCDWTFPWKISRVNYPRILKIKNIKKKASMTFNMVISKGFLLPTVNIRQPISNLQLTKNFVHHQGPH